VVTFGALLLPGMRAVEGLAGNQDPRASGDPAEPEGPAPGGTPAPVAA
jgi:hypothetical protein